MNQPFKMQVALIDERMQHYSHLFDSASEEFAKIVKDDFNITIGSKLYFENFNTTVKKIDLLLNAGETNPVLLEMGGVPSLFNARILIWY